MSDQTTQLQKKKERREKTLDELLDVDVSMLEVYSQANMAAETKHQRTLAPA